jgi:hypothetical protein
VGSPRDKQRLFELLFEAKEAPLGEKAVAWDAFYAEVDRVRKGTAFSRSQVKELLFRDGYFDYAKRRRLTERPHI